MMKRSFLLLASLSASLVGCFDQPSMLKATSGSATLSHKDEPIVVSVAVVESGNKASAVVKPSEDSTQLLSASRNSEIAGTTVAFPPGSLAVETEITIRPVETIADDAQKAQVLGAAPVETAAVAPAVAVESSAVIDAAVPFTVSLPLPDQSGLRLQEGVDQPLPTLVVFYKIRRAGEDGYAIGIFLRDEIAVDNGFAKVSTRFFGTYQAALLKSVPISKKEVAVGETEPAAPTEPAPSSEPAAPAAKGRRYYARGFLPSTFGENAISKSGLSANVRTRTPSRVGSGTILSTEWISAPRTED